MGLLIFFALIIIAVILHEFGHYLAARYYGVIAEEFNIGMGPKIAGKKIKETDWNLRILPFGGSCVLNDTKLLRLSPQKRIAIFLAGPVTNLCLSFMCFLIFCRLSGQKDLYTSTVAWIENVLGLVPGFFSSLQQAFSPAAPTIAESGEVLQETLSRQTTAEDTASYLLQISFSLNAFLFIGNILPIPALDGGQIALSIPECFHRPLSEKAVAFANRCFYLLIMAVSAAFLIKDVIITAIR